MVPDASLYDFGILTSNVHMACQRASKVDECSA